MKENKGEEKRMEMKEGEEEPVDKDVMAEVVGIAEGVVQDGKTITKEGREEERKETIGWSFHFQKFPETL